MKTLFEKLFDVLIFIIIIIGMVISYYGQRQDTLTQQLISTESSDLVNTVQTQGALTKDVYADFLSRLKTTNMIYDIKLEHKKLSIAPEYRLKTAEEIIDEQNGSYTGGNTYHYFPVSTQIPVVNDPSPGDLSMNTETNESILAKSTNTPSTGHVHTDACYDHKHVQPYGTTDMTNVPVYIRRTDGSSGYLYSDSGANIGHYNYGVTIHCGVCNRELYSVYLDNAQSTGYSSYIYHRVYTYVDTYPYRTTTTNKVEYPWEYTDDWWVKKSYIASTNFYNFYNYANVNSKVSFPWAGLPVWDANGNVSYLPFTGCTNSTSEYHINPDACQPMGKKTKVHIQAGYWISNEYYFMGDVEPMITVTCADCGKQIAGVSAHASGTSVVSPSNDDWYRTSVSSWFYGYDSNGVIKQFSNTATSSIWHNKTEAQCSEYRKINDMAISVNWAVQATYNMIPWGTGGENDTKTSWYTRTTPIDYPLPGITIERKADLINPVAWAPYRGCPYCGSFGTAYTCGKSEVTKCDKVIASIVPTHPIQAVFTGEALITTVTVTYMDGSTKVAVANTDFNTNTPITNKIVTLSLSDTLGNTKTCTITVTVVPRTKTCTHGHTYNLNNDGSDPGCPYCKAWLRSLEVVDPATGSIVIYRGTTLQDNGVLLMATYLDGRKELLDSGYANNLDRYYIGNQTVTISYKGKYTSLNVTVKRNIVQCPVCKRYYELFPDDTDPGCPYCAARVPVFTGKVLKYYSETFSNEILDEIYDGSGVYYFNDEDYFSISVTNRIKTLGTKVLSMFYQTAPEVTLHVEQGGKIRNRAADEGEK